MLAYSIIMFLSGAVCLALGIVIYKGKTDLIHDYHQKKVSDKAAYAKAFGKSLFVVAASQLLSGVIGLFADSQIIGIAAVAVLIIGLGVGIGCLVAVQRKYNKGIFLTSNLTGSCNMQKTDKGPYGYDCQSEKSGYGVDLQ